MVKTMFLVPVRDNEGNRFRQADYRELERRIIEVAGGYRKQQGGTGAWREGGTIYTDEVWEYTVSLNR